MRVLVMVKKSDRRYETLAGIRLGAATDQANIRESHRHLVDLWDTYFGVQCSDAAKEGLVEMISQLQTSALKSVILTLGEELFPVLEQAGVGSFDLVGRLLDRYADKKKGGQADAGA
jgi:hypothetical protein